MTTSDEAVEAAAKAICMGLSGISRQELEAALEAAAPFIRAEALEEAADDVDLPGSSASGYYASEQDSGYREAECHVEAWLRRRAAEMRQS